jgi:hypothetical protein
MVLNASPARRESAGASICAMSQGTSRVSPTVPALRTASRTWAGLSSISASSGAACAGVASLNSSDSASRPCGVPGTQGAVVQRMDGLVALAEQHGRARGPEAAVGIFVLQRGEARGRQIAPAAFARGAQRLRAQHHVGIGDRGIQRLAGVDHVEVAGGDGDRAAKRMGRIEHVLRDAAQRLARRPAAASATASRTSGSGSATASRRTSRGGSWFSSASTMAANTSPRPARASASSQALLPASRATARPSRCAANLSSSRRR